jgi:ubiquitin-conjugating enzyme E2 G1
MANPGGAAALVLGKQLKRMQGEDYIEGISVGLVDDNVFEWEVMLMINDDCKFYGGTQIERWRESERRDTTAERCRPLTFFFFFLGGFFRARLNFPKDYPHLPPKMKFETPIWHPNSTLHVSFARASKVKFHIPLADESKSC